jgi:NTP pyrophosphatase (non-canonical NTP hydrolase)
MIPVLYTLAEYRADVEFRAAPAGDGTVPRDLAEFCLGLAGETGEVCDLIKKHWRDNRDLDLDKLKKELGDVLWYVTMIGSRFGLALEEIAAANTAKLAARYPDGFTRDGGIR